MFALPQVLLISDIFTERSQFEWMYETLLELNKIHPVEDEVVTQYVIPGICKAASVLGMVGALLLSFLCRL